MAIIAIPLILEKHETLIRVESQKLLRKQAMLVQKDVCDCIKATMRQHLKNSINPLWGNQIKGKTLLNS